MGQTGDARWPGRRPECVKNTCGHIIDLSMPNRSIPLAQHELPTKGFPLFPPVAVRVAGCEVGSRGFSTRGRDGNLFFAPWNPPHPDFSFPAAFSLNFHQMARTKVSISFRTSTTPSSSTHPPLSLLSIPNPFFILVALPCFVTTTLLTQNLITCFSLRNQMSNKHVTCHAPSTFGNSPVMRWWLRLPSSPSSMALACWHSR